MGAKFIRGFVVVALACVGGVIVYCTNNQSSDIKDNGELTSKNMESLNDLKPQVETTNDDSNNGEIDSSSTDNNQNSNDDYTSNQALNDGYTDNKKSNSNKDSNTTESNKHKNNTQQTKDDNSNQSNSNIKDSKDNKNTNNTNNTNNKNNVKNTDNTQSKSNEKNNQYNKKSNSNKDSNATESNLNKDKRDDKNTNKSKDSKRNEAYTQNTITDINKKSEYSTCNIAPSCNNGLMSDRLAATSLDLHAKVRMKEELDAKGVRASNDFMKLWNQTRSKILPKLTSHISSIQQQYVSKSQKERICKANYYTEVLEDFGNGWKDKKGDKSPIYSVTYKISCNNTQNAKLSIVEERLLDSATHNQVPLQLDTRREPPACNAKEVYNKISETSFYFHADKRAREEGYIRGLEAQKKFENLWEQTKPQIISKLASHISNIQDKGAMANKKARLCVANYYTEVLEDFGNGWKDKKGDKSPIYIVFYTIGYKNDDSNDIVIKITAQNRTRR